jgi:hypothetical protein
MTPSDGDLLLIFSRFVTKTILLVTIRHIATGLLFPDIEFALEWSKSCRIGQIGAMP